MAILTPIELTLYDPETNEPLKTHARSFVSWEVMKRALQLQKEIDIENLSEENIEGMEALLGLVVTVYGDQFSTEELFRGADMGELLTVLQAVLNRAAKFVEGRKLNPPPPGDRPRKRH